MKGKIFNDQEVQAILNGSKVMFREVIKNNLLKSCYKIGSFDEFTGKSESEMMPCNHSWAGKRIGMICSDCWKELLVKCPYQVGQKIFVKETFAYIQDPNECAKENEPCEIHYKADYDAEGLDKHDIKAIGTEFLPASRMPQWTSRLTLQIKSIGVERLGDISEEDCWKEGLEEFADYQDQVKVCQMAKKLSECAEDPRPYFATWWNATHKKPEEKWEASPFVFVYEFELIK